MPTSSSKTMRIILLLAPLLLAAGFAMDIYVPSLPTIVKVFNTSPGMVQLTVSLYLLADGLFLLVAGPLADQTGRRPMIITGIIIYIGGAFISTVALHINILIIGRIIQAIGSCTMMVGAFAVVRDSFSAKECAKVYSFLNSVFAFSPLFAPIIGGYLDKYISWRASFVFLGLMGIIIGILSFIKIKESLPPEKRVPITKRVFANYASILFNTQFLVYVFCASVGMASFFTFFSISPYIIINLLHIPLEHFGYYFALIGIVFFFGSLFSGLLAGRIGAFNTVLIGTFLIWISGLIMLLWFFIDGLSIWNFIIPMLGVAVGGAMVLGAGAGGAMAPFPMIAGAASALLGCIELVFGFAVSTFVLQWEIKSTVPLALTMLILGILATIVCLIFRRQCKTT